MSIFEIPEFAAPETVKKKVIKVSSSQPSQPKSLAPAPAEPLPSAPPQVMPRGPETQPAPGLPDRSWETHQSSPAQLTASDLIAGDREIWAKGVILAMILGKPRCKSRGWR